MYIDLQITKSDKLRHYFTTSVPQGAPIILTDTLTTSYEPMIIAVVPLWFHAFYQASLDCILDKFTSKLNIPRQRFKVVCLQYTMKTCDTRPIPRITRDQLLSRDFSFLPEECSAGAIALLLHATSQNPRNVLTVQLLSVLSFHTCWSNA